MHTYTYIQTDMHAYIHTYIQAYIDTRMLCCLFTLHYIYVQKIVHKDGQIDEREADKQM